MNELTKGRYEKIATFCGKEYKVGYFLEDKHDECRWVKGLMENYSNGNVVLSNENGVYHIPYSNIKWILPVPVKKEVKT